MARTRATNEPPHDGPAAGGDRDGYTVVARRYRPQTFEEVVGQDHVVQALRNAIKLNRVTHAYLFSGTRGVGKTSIARIFAKALNCVHGPTESPCNACDICQAISVGQDVDVIEIDGASNNGVEAVRELRQNAGLRPSRARFKIYYIDEVHMLSTGAFNALLKTLEEPPEHVKFFFATTEPNKIPITVLSRCQKYDFAGITPEQIVETLASICDREGMKADREALTVLARRAGGSMRDAQSLLEQILSFGGEGLTAENVHKALGIAPDERILDLIDALADRDPGRALGLVESAMKIGVQPADLLSGSLDFLRDAMVASVTLSTKQAGSVPMLTASPSQEKRLREIAAKWPLDSILAVMQILDQAKGRLRGSSHGRLIVELALARAARIEDFAELGELVGRLTAAGGESAPSVKKKLSPPAAEAPPRIAEPPPRAAQALPRAAEPAPRVVAEPPTRPAPPEPPVERLPLALEVAGAAWTNGLPMKLGVRIGARIAPFRPSAIEPPEILVVDVPHSYNEDAVACEQPEVRSRIESALADLLGRPVAVKFRRVADAPSAPVEDESKPSRAELGDQFTTDPWVRNIKDLFEIPPNPVQIEYDDQPPGA